LSATRMRASAQALRHGSGGSKWPLVVSALAGTARIAAVSGIAIAETVAASNFVRLRVAFMAYSVVCDRGFVVDRGPDGRVLISLRALIAGPRE